MQILRRRAIVYSQRLLNVVYPFAMPVADRLTSALRGSSDVVVLLFAVAVLFLLWQVFAAVSRLLVWWTGIAFRILLWALVVGALAVVWQRGIDTTVRDLATAYGVAAGVALYLRDVVMHFWNAYEQQSRSNSRGGYGSGNRYGSSRGRTGVR